MSKPRVVRIGDATLYRGDAREVCATLDPVDMIFADPPYGHNNNNGDLIHRWEAALGRLPCGAATPLGRPIANDGAEATDLAAWLFGEARRLLRPGGCCCCCCGGGGPDPQFARWSMLMDQHLDFLQMVVWDKGPIGMGWRYRRSYETVLVGAKPGAKVRWYDDSKTVENIIRPGDYEIRKIIPRATDHPTPKPWQLAAHFVSLHTEPGHTVLDPFMGGGSTGVACVEEECAFIGIELDPAHFASAVRRMEAAHRARDAREAA